MIIKRYQRYHIQYIAVYSNTVPSKRNVIPRINYIQHEVQRRCTLSSLFRNISDNLVLLRYNNDDLVGLSSKK